MAEWIQARDCKSRYVGSTPTPLSVIRIMPGAARIIAHMVAIMSHVGVIMSQLISRIPSKIEKFGMVIAV